MAGKVLVVGSLNVDTIAAVSALPRPGETVIADWSAVQAGGKGANQAVAARAAGAEVALVGAVGADDHGRAYLARLIALGIDVGGVRVDPELPTGQAVVTSATESGGENTIVVLPGANGWSWTWPDHVGAALDRCAPGDVVLVQLEIPVPVVEWVVTAASERDLQVVLNLSPYADLAGQPLTMVDVVVVNEVEALTLADRGVAAPQSIVVTLGASGACWDGLRRTGPRVPEHEVRDTVGAGDAFCGTLAARLAQGYDRDEALDAALAAGAAAVRYVGAQPGACLVPPAGGRWRLGMHP